MRRGAPVLFGSLAGYRPRWLRRDLVAGLTVWAVLVPESLAYASIAVWDKNTRRGGSSLGITHSIPALTQRENTWAAAIQRLLPALGEA